MSRVAVLIAAQVTSLLLTPCMVHAVSFQLTHTVEVNPYMTDENLPSLLGATESCGSSLDFPFSVQRPEAEKPTCGKGESCLERATSITKQENSVVPGAHIATQIAFPSSVTTIPYANTALPHTLRVHGPPGSLAFLHVAAVVKRE